MDYVHATSNHLREELESKLKIMKDEQRRKFDLLYQRYEEAVQTMLDQENVKNFKRIYSFL
jgi:hypothetical protein